MNANRLGRRWLATLALGTVAPLVFAQLGPPGGVRGHGEGHNNPRFQQCLKQAEDKHLPEGPERRAFMEQCLKSGGDEKDNAKGAELRDKMRQGQGGHLHSDPPPPAPAAPVAPATPAQSGS